ncbi:hypothetical protein PT974_09663 [Cladobotryum mycophilum]|uniref:Serine protease n=1 Tax=Cladobotryum mycophilum TaxID=491253 RepID=A0ABR0SHR2_9HYPO
MSLLVNPAARLNLGMRSGRDALRAKRDKLVNISATVIMKDHLLQVFAKATYPYPTRKMPFRRLMDGDELDINGGELIQPEVEKNLDKLDIEDIYSCIVRLKFEFNGNVHMGTGFYVNLPSEKYHVILTAGHNLINEEGIRAENLVIIGEDNVKDPATLFMVCLQYEKTQRRTMAGMITVKNIERPGFGLNLGFSSNKFLHNITQLTVSGFEDRQYNPVTSFGEGMSGSPVWHGYGGFAVAVAIHNLRAEKPGQGNKGTLINEEVFDNICRWSNAGYFAKRVYVDEADAMKNHQIYLSFAQYSGLANVYLGSSQDASKRDSLKFDIIPVYVSQSSSGRDPLYAFRFHRPQSWGEAKKRWVEWQPEKQRAILVESLKDINLVRLARGRRKTEVPFKIVLPSKKPTSRTTSTVLMLTDEDRDDDDIEDGMDECAGVSFGKDVPVGNNGGGVQLMAPNYRWFRIEN